MAKQSQRQCAEIASSCYALLAKTQSKFFDKYMKDIGPPGWPDSHYKRSGAKRLYRLACLSVFGLQV